MHVQKKREKKDIEQIQRYNMCTIKIYMYTCVVSKSMFNPMYIHSHEKGSLV